MINLIVMTSDHFVGTGISASRYGAFGVMIGDCEFKELSERTETDFLEWFFDRAESGNERYMELRYDMAMRNDDWVKESTCVAYDYLDHLIEMTSAY